jgi:hypothetical protein
MEIPERIITKILMTIAEHYPYSYRDIRRLFNSVGKSLDSTMEILETAGKHAIRPDVLVTEALKQYRKRKQC